MYYVYNCGTNALIGTAQNQREAFAIAKNALENDKDPRQYDYFVADNSRGASRIIGFASTGFIPDEHDQTDPCTRGGSVLFGRETE